MKKISTFSAITVLVSMLSFTPGLAQGNAFFAVNKTVVSTIPIPVASINARAVKHFKKEYAGVTNATWYEIPGGLISKFEKDGICYRLGFDKNGNQVNNMRTYHEAQLPAAIRQLVKSNYYDCSIELVEEVGAAGQLAYIIHLEDSKTAKKIKIQNDEISIVEEYKK